MKKEVHDLVNRFYTDAANEPQEALCCASAYSAETVSHIPENVLNISYGCGSPVSLAGIGPAEVVVDLGSGGGIDCFIAAKIVGGSGRVIGIDMTDKMLDIATAAAAEVAARLGFGNVEFKKGLLEDIPLDDGIADIITSNCVLNLSPDKEQVFEEIYRVLKPGGRFCISDVVAQRELPEEILNDEKLWGECLAGALTEEELMGAASEAGFYGLHVVSRSLYRKLGNIRFDSIVLNGYKPAGTEGYVYAGEYAIYNGPFKTVRDDDGHEYPAGVPVKVCTDTVEKLCRAPYEGLFSIIDSGNGLKAQEKGKSGRCC